MKIWEELTDEKIKGFIFSIADSHVGVHRLSIAFNVCIFWDLRPPTQAQNKEERMVNAAWVKFYQRTRIEKIVDEMIAEKQLEVFDDGKYLKRPDGQHREEQALRNRYGG